MKNRARIPYHARRKAYRWTRPPDKPAPAERETCPPGRHIWVFRDDVPENETMCLCGTVKYREMSRE